jgi:hypothetical protein
MISAAITPAPSRHHQTESPAVHRLCRSVPALWILDAPRGNRRSAVRGRSRAAARESLSELLMAAFRQQATDAPAIAAHISTAVAVTDPRRDRT